MSVPMKVVVATNRKKCVPDKYAGDASDMHNMPSICNKKTIDLNERCFPVVK